MRKQFNTLDFGPIIPMGPSDFGKAPEFPRPGEHPRLLFTKDMIPNIRRALDDPKLENAKSALLKKCATEFDGLLPTAYYHAEGRKGIHNYNAEGLEIIKAKAFTYAIYGDKELAYQAIDAMQNYLLTINIRFIYCDQCRAFGNIAYVVACLYDWCYDVLTEDEKHNLIAGTINYAVAGDSGMLQNDDPLFHNYAMVVRKMEIGYPPKIGSSFMGHGAEEQLTRDYMSGAIAFYDENPDWWEYVAGRYFNGFIPERNALFEGKTFTQGVHYGNVRLEADMWAAFAHKILFGKNPHNDTMLEVIKSSWHMELPNESFWSEGDVATRDIRQLPTLSMSRNALIMAAIYKDKSLLAERLWKFPNIVGSSASPDDIVYASEVIDIIPPENRHEGFSPLHYRPVFQNKMLVRREWDNPDSPAVYMKIGARSTGSHEHADAGTFQLFYKDHLTHDSGIYDWCGCLYSSGTVSHNGVTVFNPEKAGTLGDRYAGGQRFTYYAETLDEWLSEKYHVGDAEGASYALKDGKTDYAYIAGNIAPAYDGDVEYLSRRMLSIFTETKEFPLIFACYDRITAISGDFKKSVLLHADHEPKIDGNRVTLTNGGGKLVANYLSDSKLQVTSIGGENNNRVINGKQVPVNYWRGGVWHTLWGRVEVSPELGNKTDDVLAVMLATDAENEFAHEVKKFSTDKILGATVMNNALIFIKDISCPEDIYEISVCGDGEMTYYISGLSAGKWTAEASGKTVELNVSEEERFARFKLPFGKLTLKKS